MKKQLLKSALIALAGVGLLVGNAMATPVNVTEANGEDSLNTIFADQGWAIDANSDQVAVDDYWKISEALSGSFSTLVIEIAGNALTNTFGLFDKSGHELELFDGPADAGDSVAIKFIGGKLFATLYDENGQTAIASNVTFDQVFGYYIGVEGGQKFFSDPSFNPDQSDQMVSYAGTGINGLSLGHYAIAFEDTPYLNSDQDFNDMVLLVESVDPVPEPATMLLFGTGIAGLAGFARRRKASN